MKRKNIDIKLAAWIIIFFMGGSLTQIIFGLLGTVTFAMTMLLIALLEYHNIINWRKYQPK